MVIVIRYIYAFVFIETVTKRTIAITPRLLRIKYITLFLMLYDTMHLLITEDNFQHNGAIFFD